MVRLIKGNILDSQADAVIVPATERLKTLSGVPKLVAKAAGYDAMREALDAIGLCKTGAATSTPGLALGAEHVIHAVAPKWHGGLEGELEELERAYESAFGIAAKLGAGTVDAVLIGTGAYRVPLCATLDACKAAYAKGGYSEAFSLRVIHPDPAKVASSAEGYAPVDRRAWALRQAEELAESNELRTWMAQGHRSWGRLLEAHRRDKGISATRMAELLGISRTTWNNWASGLTETPRERRDALIAAALALGLGADEARGLFARAKTALDPSDERDLLISYFFETGNADLDLANAVLHLRGMKALVDVEAHEGKRGKKA